LQDELSNYDRLYADAILERDALSQQLSEALNLVDVYSRDMELLKWRV
jgi:hypothetical protein